MNNNFIPMSSYLAGELGSAVGNFENTYGVTAAASTRATCEGTSCSGVACQTTCSGTCSGVACQTTCTGTCSGVSCQTTCTGGCSGGCKGSCSSTCTGNCKGSCTSGCETYCASICQTYCEKEQTYSKNNTAANNPGGSVFTWTNSNVADGIINILASDWNTLASYVEKASAYCASSKISNISRATAGGFITAKIFNDLDGSIGSLNNADSVGTKTADVDLIIAKDINDLATNYNKATITSTLPANTTGAKDKCCQKGMSCMTQASGRPSLQPCVDQTVNKKCTKRQ